MKKLFFVYVFLTLGTMLEAQNTFGGAGFRERNSKSVNYFMSYSCQKGEVVPDNSTYTALLAKALSSPMGDLEDIFKYVRSETLAQILFYYSGMGMETDSGTWIFPVDAKGNDTGDSWNLQGICQKWTLALPAEAVKICIYDACRNDFSKSR